MAEEFMLGINYHKCYCPNASLSYKFGAYTHRLQGLTVIQVMWENMPSTAALVLYTIHGLILAGHRQISTSTDWNDLSLLNLDPRNPYHSFLILFLAPGQLGRDLKKTNLSSPNCCAAYPTPQLRVSHTYVTGTDSGIDSAHGKLSSNFELWLSLSFKCTNSRQTWIFRSFGLAYSAHLFDLLLSEQPAFFCCPHLQSCRSSWRERSICPTEDSIKCTCRGGRKGCLIK